MVKAFPLEASQLSIESAIAKQLTQLKDADVIELFPKLHQFVDFCGNQSQNCFLLSSLYGPAEVVEHGIDFSSGSINSFFGHFELDTNKHIVFSQNENLSQIQPIYIPALLLLQDFDFSELLIKTLNAREFNSRWLLSGGSSTDIIMARHKTIPVALNVVIYGASHDLLTLCSQWPMLDKISKSIIHEADIAFQPETSAISAFARFYNLRYKTEINSVQLSAILWALARHAEDQSWLILDIDYLDKLDQLLPIDYVKSDVEFAVNKLSGHFSHVKNFNYDQLCRGVVKVEVQGEAIAQINGLTVVETDHAEFGEPSRITANVFVGDGDIGDIERKSDLGGNIHAKAMLILSSYVSRQFARNAPLPVSSNIVFEQSYHEVDGDSASVAELYALLSALAEIPLRQNVAITGAMDQHGNVQAVGGVDLKIESFFDISQKRQAKQQPIVVIPYSNIQHLNLSQRIIDAVASKTLTIVGIKHVDEAAIILTGLPAECESGESVNEKVRLALDKFEHETEIHPTFKQKLARFFKLYTN